MLNTNIKVPMPKEKIVFRKQYVYYRTRVYRNAKRQPTNDTVLIGKKDQESGMLIPNNKYYKIFGTEPKEKSDQEIAPNAILDYGNNYLLVSVKLFPPCKNQSNFEKTRENDSS